MRFGREERRGTVNRRRKGVLAVILPWLKRFGIVIGILAVAMWVGAWLWMSGTVQEGKDWAYNKVLVATSDMGFTVENVLVEGRVYSNAEFLKSVLNVNKGDPLFAFDPATTKAAVEKIPWIKHARVERRLPDTIFVGIEERQPLALWQKDQKLSLIDADGKILSTDGMQRFKDLVIVIGDDAPAHAPDLINMLSSEKILYDRTTAATWMGQRRWDLTLKKDIEVKLPETDMGLALRRLAKAQEEDALLDKDITSIDLREPDRIVVRTRPGAVQEYKAGLKAGDNI